MRVNYTGRPLEILLVDDNPGDVRLTTEALREAKVINTIHVAGDGEAAMAFLRKEGEHASAPRPDVILLDLNLPKKDGRDVLQDIKNSAEFRQIPVVVLTTSSAERDIVRSYELAANCYITKPVDLDQFLAAVRAIEHFWLSVVTLPPASHG